LLARPSGTEEIFRIFAESKIASDARDLANRYKTTLSEIVKEKNRNA
jgi:phosphomannomutase